MTMVPSFDLKGRVALITGGSRGLGLAMAEMLGQAGATVVITARSKEQLEASAAGLRAKNIACEAIAFDAGDVAAGQAAVAQIVKAHGRLDIYIANAGIQHRSPLEEWTEEKWDMVQGTNLRAAFFLAQAAAAPMKAQGYGRMIFISSITTRFGRATIHAYAASKAGTVSLARSLASELGMAGITCNAIAPGYFETDMNEALLKDPAFVERITNRTALRRWGKPEELAGVALLLASEAGGYITGQEFAVDGGFSGTM
jgi:gluconate 5-dehydrogenase